MENSAEQQKLNDYQKRVSDWIGNQGILFQLRYARTSGGGSFFRNLSSLVIRLVIILAVLAGVGYFLIGRHFASDRYKESISGRIESSLGLSSIEGGGFSRSEGSGGYRDLSLEGGEGSFFYQAKLEGFKAPFEYLTGITGKWNPDSIRAEKVEVNLKAGGTQEEMEESFAGLLSTLSGKGITSVRFDDFSCDWGYSTMTYGRIANSVLKADLEGGKWKVSLEGGKFQQNWLRGLTIERGDLVIDDSGIRVTSLKLNSGVASLDLSGSIKGPLNRPQFDLAGLFKKLAVENLLRVDGIATREFVEGRVTGDLRITGSTNQHIAISGTARLEEGDRLTIRERWTILKAISIIDTQRTFRRVDFDTGSFRFSSGEGGMKLEEISLSGNNTARLEGSLETRLPTQKEAADALGITLTEGFSSDLTDTSAAQELEDDRVSLKEAVGRGGRVDDLTFDRSLSNVPRKADARMSATELEEIRLRAEMKVHRINGMLRLAIPATSFDDNENLARLYPVDDEGWRWIDIPVKESSFQNISSKTNEKILDQGRERAGSGTQ